MTYCTYMRFLSDSEFPKAKDCESSLPSSPSAGPARVLKPRGFPELLGKARGVLLQEEVLYPSGGS